MFAVWGVEGIRVSHYEFMRLNDCEVGSIAGKNLKRAESPNNKNKP